MRNTRSAQGLRAVLFITIFEKFGLIVILHSGSFDMLYLQASIDIIMNVDMPLQCFNVLQHLDPAGGRVQTC